MYANRLCLAVFIASLFCTPAWAIDLSLKTEPYLTSNLFSRPLLPAENDKVMLGLELPAPPEVKTAPAVDLKVRDSRGTIVFTQRATLKRDGDKFRAEVEWPTGKNGLYKVAAVIDPDNAIAETDEKNNSGELLLPVLVKDRPLYFPWYRTTPLSRWGNVSTSTGEKDAPALARRGIAPLAWAYGGMSWSYVDNKLFENEKDRPAAMQELEDKFAGVYAGNCAPTIAGFGLDEMGGYPGSAAYYKSIASLKGLIRARQARPDRFFAIWKSGGVSTEMAGLMRQAANLVLLETYVWRAQPNELGADDIYQAIRNRLDPVIRSLDMLTPVYGNHCHTLIALDTSERPDYTDLGEQENVVRFIRRICPEMHGLAHYNGGYGGYGIEKTPETDAKHQAVVRNADHLCFKYYIMPCLTLARESLWLTPTQESTELVAAVSNIGGIDSGPVTVALYDGAQRLGEVVLDKVPAGGHRNANRAFARLAITPKPGLHNFTARLEHVEQATVLDGEIALSRYIAP